MPDREKAIKGIDSCLRFNCGKDCTYYDNCGIGCTEQLRKDVIALLKEQEAVKPKLVGENMWRCGKCEALLGWEDFTPSGLELIEYKFCPECGQAVKWE